jgi:transposase
MNAHSESDRSLQMKPISGDRKRGRPRALSGMDLVELKNLMHSNPSLTLHEISKHMEKHMGQSLALMTWSRALRQLGLRKINGRRSFSSAESTPTHHPSASISPLEGFALLPAFLTDREWEAVQTIAETPIGRGRPPVHDRRLMWNAVFYMIRTGTPWRSMPSNFPSHKAVFAFYTKIKESGQLAKALETLHVLWQDRSLRRASSESLTRSA